MSQTYWTIKGIGIEQQDLVPLLDGDKLAKLMEKEAEYAFPIDDIEKEDSFSSLNNQEKVELLMDNYVCSEHEQLPSLLYAADTTDFLITANNGDDRYFLLYTPKHPWHSTDMFSAEEDVIKYITDLVIQYCRDDVSREAIEAIIDTDIDEVGCC